jgi:hypothetical protein
LVAIILDLLMEVEALRTAVLASQTETSGKDSDYARAYRDTAYLTHNAAGPSSGLEKLLAQFYPRSLEREGRDERQGRAWRECLFLRRLGFTEDEIRAYKEEAEEAEAFT